MDRLNAYVALFVGIVYIVIDELKQERARNEQKRSRYR